MAATMSSETNEESQSLAIQLRQEDSPKEASDAARKGEQKEGTLTDKQLALGISKEELEATTACSSDRRRIIHSAEQTDSDALVQSKSSQADQEEFLLGEDLMKRLECMDVTKRTGGIDDDEAQPSDHLSELRQEENCVACTESKSIDELLTAPCQHQYCGQCINKLFLAAMVDESLFPPRCCRQFIPLEQSKHLLHDEVARAYPHKAVEFSTVNRTYCHKCAAFIPPTSYCDSTAICIECSSKTCITCKQTSHKGDCPADEQLQQVIHLAEQEGWQRCSNCQTMVELNTGCNHMTFQFCYVCAAPWKTCDCAQWNENRLVDRAAGIDARAQPPLNNRRLRQIRRIARNLRDQHECDHERCRKRYGANQCHQCDDNMTHFVFECRQCLILLCGRCKRNRL
ncbi:hypothetical protein GGR57DRAFT_496789 [Xylariaceae sp. FL1272]|nr:hypothetical protein GGR57DRAFT_496789 [Xylariaceae sp. FL1272]